MVNKSDLPNAEEVFKQIKRRYKKRDIFLISAATSDGISKLLDKIITLLPKIKEPSFLKIKPKKISRLDRTIKIGFSIMRNSDGMMEIKSENIKKLISMTNFSQEEAVERLKNIFKLIGLDKALKNEGVAEGEIIKIEDKEFEWFEPDASQTRKKSKFQYKYTLQLKKRRKIKNK